MTGKITVILLIGITLIFGIVFFYFQTYAYYSKVDAKEQIIVNLLRQNLLKHKEKEYMILILEVIFKV